MVEGHSGRDSQVVFGGWTMASGTMPLAPSGSRSAITPSRRSRPNTLLPAQIIIREAGCCHRATGPMRNSTLPASSQSPGPQRDVRNWGFLGCWPTHRGEILWTDPELAKLQRSPQIGKGLSSSSNRSQAMGSRSPGQEHCCLDSCCAPTPQNLRRIHRSERQFVTPQLPSRGVRVVVPQPTPQFDC